VFSNFGGLNCISPSEVEQLLNDLRSVLTLKGRVILIIMPKFCAWESAYYTTRLQLRNAFRRASSQPIKASVGSSEVSTWYHSPESIKRIASKYYNIKNVQPVGLSIPPSYLQKSILARKKILNTLDKLENRLNKYSFFSAIADHYLIDLELK